MIFNRAHSIGFCSPLLLLFTLFSAQLSEPVQAEEKLPTKAVEEFVTVLQQIKRNYVFQQSDEALIESSIRGMVSSLDPFSRYLNAEELAQFQNASNTSTGQAAWSVTELDNGYVVLDIDFFQLGIADVIASELGKVTPIQGLAIDLRQNGGGFVDSAVAVADLFLNNKLVVDARGRSAEANRNLSTSAKTPLGTVPMVIVVDSSTASAAEIFSAALQDHDRAVIIGESTYGKGTVQSLIYTNFGAIQITTSMNYRPSGSAIQGEGVVPDFNLLDAAEVQRFVSSSEWYEQLYHVIVEPKNSVNKATKP